MRLPSIARAIPLLLTRCLPLFVVFFIVSETSGALLPDNDPLRSKQWYLDRLRVPQAWSAIAQANRRSPTTIAVLDSGFQTDHPDLSASLLPGVNVTNGSSDVSAVNPHGTGTSGLISAQYNNSTGIAPVVPGSSILPLRISNSRDGSALTDTMAWGIRHAADAGARIINISYSGLDDTSVQASAKYAYEKGALVFMAAGNSGRPERWSNSPYIAAVGATDKYDRRAGFSSTGNFVDFAAPGQDVPSLTTQSTYTNWSGTSFASPIAAGVAALVLEANPKLSPSQILRILRLTAVDLGKKGYDSSFGHGRLDALAAVQMALRTTGTWKPTALQSATLSPATMTGLASHSSAVEEIAKLNAKNKNKNTPAVPEPASAVMMAIGVLVMASRRRRISEC